VGIPITQNMAHKNPTKIYSIWRGKISDLGFKNWGVPTLGGRTWGGAHFFKRGSPLKGIKKGDSQLGGGVKK